MNKYNKNIASILIFVCLVSIVIKLFIPNHANRNITKTSAVKTLGPNAIPVFSPVSITGPFKSERITVIKIEGIIKDSEEGSFFRDNTSSAAALEFIERAARDNNIKAIVIKINSPGGTVAASQELYRAILKARKLKPVVITMGDIAASGGYYIASAGDIIFANPGTLTGSIGVITSYLNFTDLLTKIGVRGVTIKSGEYKDIGNPTRPLTEEERKILQALLDNTYDQFVTDVANARRTKKPEIEKLAKGLIYTGKQAVKVKLVDKLGGYYESLDYAQRLAKKRFPYLQHKYHATPLPTEETWKKGSFLDTLLSAINKTILPKSKFNDRIFKSYSFSRYQPLWLLE